jgi:hypothetical protein
VQVEADLHYILKKLSDESGLSITQIIVQYIQYLRTVHFKKRKPLHANSNGDFKLDIPNRRRVQKVDAEEEQNNDRGI